MPKANFDKKKNVTFPRPKMRAKLGKKKLKPRASQPIIYQTKKLFIQEQNLRSKEVVEGTCVTSKNLSLNDIITKLNHYKPKTVKEALNALKELIERHPLIIHTHLTTILKKTLKCIHMNEPSVNKVIEKVVKWLFPQVSGPMIKSHLPMIVSYICSSLSHIETFQRLFGMKLMQEVMKNYGNLIGEYAPRLLPALDNIFLMEKVGYAYKGDKKKRTQALAIPCLDQLISIIFSCNRLNIQENDALQIQCHLQTQQQNAKQQQPQNNKMTAYNASQLMTFTQDNFERENSVSLLQQLVLRYVLKKEQQGTTSNSIQQRLAKSSLTHDMYTLETIYSIETLIGQLFPILMDHLIEQLPTITHKAQGVIHSSENLKAIVHILHILYRCLYAYEDVAKGEFYNQDLMMAFFLEYKDFFLQNFPFKGAVRYRDEENSDISIHHANILMLSTLSYFVGRRTKDRRFKDTPFFHTQQGVITEWEKKYVHEFIDMFQVVRTGERTIDLQYLLGSFYRIYPHVEYHDAMWDVFLKRYKEVSAAKAKCMLFFLEHAILPHHLTHLPNMTILKPFTQLLCQQMHTSDNHLRQFVLSLLRAFSKIKSLEDLISNVVLQEDFVQFFYNHETNMMGPFLELSTAQQAMILSLFPSIPGKFSSRWMRAFQVLSQDDTFSSSQGFLMLLETIRIKFLQDEEAMRNDEDDDFVKALLIFILSAFIHIPITRTQQEWLLVQELVLLYKTAAKAHPKLIQLLRNTLTRIESLSAIHQVTHLSRFIRILVLHPDRKLLKKDLIWLVLQCHLLATNEREVSRDRVTGIDHVFYLNTLLHSHQDVFARILSDERLSLSALFFLSRQLPLRSLFIKHQDLINKMLQERSATLEEEEKPLFKEISSTLSMFYMA